MATAEEYQLYPGTMLGKYYKVEKILGQGSFGFVTKCINTETNEEVAIKVNKNDPDAFYLARQEIAILKKLRRLDPDTCNIAKWNGFFFHKENICLNFELLDQSLDSAMRSRDGKCLTVTELREIIRQLATTLHHLSLKEVIHGDIKPENIMMVDSQQQPVQVKLIDFGLACTVSDVDVKYIQGTKEYMAPEILLQIPYNEAVDMWALGQAVAEMATGRRLYTTGGVYDMLQQIIQIQGPPPDHMLDRGRGTENYFDREMDGWEGWNFKSPEQYSWETGENPTVKEFHRLRCLDDLEQLMVNNGEDQRESHLLVDLIKRMLHLDPDERIKPLEVLQHPFITQSLPESCSPGASIEEIDEEETPEFNHFDETAAPSFENTSVHEAQSETWEEEATGDQLHVNPGSTLGECYKVLSTLGEGGFGRVTKCLNTKTNKVVAIKVMKDDPDSVCQAKKEIVILEKLRCLDPDTCSIVKWHDCFFHNNVVCLSFELLDQSLFDYMSARDFKGLPIHELATIISQLAMTLCHLGSIEVIHADIKPGNIMIVDSREQPLLVKLIDFGLACTASDVDPKVIKGTYVAPEMLLQIPYDEAIDMWALGQTVAELATGRCLYDFASVFGEVYDMLHQIIQVQGQPPDHVLDRGQATKYYFDRQSAGCQKWTFKTPQQYQTGKEATGKGFNGLRCLDDVELLMVRNGEDQSHSHQLVELIKKMLHLDPEQRVKPLEVLQHPFFIRM